MRQLDEASAQVAPAMDKPSWSLRPLRASQPIIVLIGVGLEELHAEAPKEAFGMLATAPWRTVEQYDGRTLAAVAAIIGSDRSEEALPAHSAPRIEHRHSGLVYELECFDAYCKLEELKMLGNLHVVNRPFTKAVPSSIRGFPHGGA